MGQGKGVPGSGYCTLSPGMFQGAVYTQTPVIPSTPWALISGFLTLSSTGVVAGPCVGGYGWWYPGSGWCGGTRVWGGGGTRAWCMGAPWYGSGCPLLHQPLYHTTAPDTVPHHCTTPLYRAGYSTTTVPGWLQYHHCTAWATAPRTTVLYCLGHCTTRSTGRLGFTPVPLAG